jgi:hypothetical protein
VRRIRRPLAPRHSFSEGPPRGERDGVRGFQEQLQENINAVLSISQSPSIQRLGVPDRNAVAHALAINMRLDCACPRSYSPRTLTQISDTADERKQNMKHTSRLLYSFLLAAAFVIGPLAPSAYTQNDCAMVPEDLVGWWKGEGDALDQAGLNHGILLGDTVYGPGRVGQGYVLDGKGDGVLVGEAMELQLQDFTIEAWIQRGSTTLASYDFGGSQIFGFGHGGYGLGMFDNGDLFLSEIGISAAVAQTRIDDLEFHHVVVTKSGADVVFYVDGQARTVTPYYATFIFQSSAAIGVRADNLENGFLGMIDEVAVYARALSTAEVQEIYAAGAAGKCIGSQACVEPPAGLVGWWPGNGNAKDIIGGNHGIFSEAMYAAGKVGLAFGFDRSGNHIRVPSATILDLGRGTGLTIEAWINPADLSIEAPIVEWGSDSGFGAHFHGNVHRQHGVQPGYLFANIFDTNGSEHVIQTQESVLRLGQFQHVALTYDHASGVGRLFHNGAVVQQSHLGNFTPRTSGDLFIGYRPPTAPSGSVAFHGQLDEVSLYERALTEAELFRIYQAGANGKCEPTTMRRALARWAFDEAEGSIASDSIGARHGVLSAAGAEFTPDGVRGNALRLTRSEGGYVDMGNTLNVTNDFTLVVWVRTEPNDTTESMVVAGKHEAGTINGYYLSLNRSGFIGQSGKALFVASDPVGEELVSTNDVNTGPWQQLAAVYERGVQKQIYVNAWPERSGPATAIIPNDASFLVGGATVAHTPQGFFNGWIDELQIFPWALSSTEVRYLYTHPDAEEIPDVREPVIIRNVVAGDVGRGTDVELSVEATGTPPLYYHWRKDGSVLESIDGPLLLLPNVQPVDDGEYCVIVTNAWGAAFSCATVRVMQPPWITAPPVAQSVALGGSATLSITAEGVSPLTYQWIKNGSDIPGGTSRFLLLNNVTELTAGDYRVRVQNPDGAVLSEAVAVTVYSGLLSTSKLDSGVQLQVNGLQIGRNYVLEFSSLMPAPVDSWEPLLTVLNAGESFLFIDPEPPLSGSRYYRVRVLP